MAATRTKKPTKAKAVKTVKATRKPTKATKPKAAAPVKTKAVTGKLPKAKTRKSLDEMSVAHREHIEKWDPHLEALRAIFVWVAVSRVPGRGVTGPYYVAVKRGAKDYAIVDYDTEKQVSVTPKRVLADGFETSAAMMEAFKEFRKKARTEREAAKAPKASKPPTRKAAPKTPRAKSTKASTAKKAPSKAKKGKGKARKPASKK